MRDDRWTAPIDDDVDPQGSDDLPLRPGQDRERFTVLHGGGELGALLRAHDWAHAVLGPPEQWPQSLKTAVRIMLTSRQPIWIGWGEALTFLYNDPYKSIIGGKHPWALGRPTSEVWREIWPDIAPLLATAMSGDEGTYVEDQLLIMERNGYPEETYYTFSYSPIPNDDGSPGGIICANTDETKRVIGERQLALLQELAARTADARSCREACERAARALGVNGHDLPFAMLHVAGADGSAPALAGAAGLGLDDAVAQHPLWGSLGVTSGAEPLLVGGLSRTFDAPLPTGPWSRAPEQAAIIPIQPSGDRGRSGFLVVGLNPFRLFDEDYKNFLVLVASQIGSAIANADAYEQERQRAEALAELDRAKTVFFSNISHEFRTPLTLMLGPLEDVLSKTEEIGAGDRRLVEVAHRNGLRLLKLVNSLLDFSRIEAGRLQATYEATDVAAFTAELASTFRSATDQAGLTLAIVARPLPGPAHLDRDMWEKVILNLLSNAFKFTFEGEIRVEIGPSADGSAVEVVVSDTGTGIPAEDLPKLFERFHRVEGAKGRSFEGSGIGLALVMELVKLHGGEVRAESELGRGSRFTVTVPLGTAHLPQDRIRTERSAAPNLARAAAFAEEARRWLPSDGGDMSFLSATTLGGGIAQASATLPSGRSGRVLVCDDNADMRAYVERLLRSQGFEVDVAENGRAALAVARQQRPDLILSDVMMPVLDGFGLVQALRLDPSLRDIPAVLLSARAGEEARIEGLASGADDCLTKPFSARELVARVQSNIALALVRREAADALREREERLRAALEASGTGTFRWDIRTNALDFDEALDRLFDLPAGQTVGSLKQFFALVHPDDRAGVIERCEASARDGTGFEMEFRVVWRDRSVHWLYDRGKTFRDSDGRPAYMAGACVDITERKRNEDARHLLLRELNHRVKNLFSITAGMVNTTARTAATTAEMAQMLTGRLNALARAHDLIRSAISTDTIEAAAAALDELIAVVLKPHLTAAGDQLTVDGTEITVGPTAATSLALVFHELATNAIKYGALSVPEGRLDIGWQRQGEALVLTWTESGGPPITEPPSRAGFGNRLAQLSAGGQLGGGIAYDWNRAGVRITLRAAMERLRQ